MNATEIAELHRFDSHPTASPSCVGCGWNGQRLDENIGTAQRRHIAEAAVEAERERIAAAIEAAYENWRTLADPDHLLPEKARLHSTQWFVERVYADAARIARTGADQ